MNNTEHVVWRYSFTKITYAIERMARGPFAVRKAWLSREIYGLLNDNGPPLREPSWIFSFGAGNAASRDRRNHDQFWRGIYRPLCT